MRSPTPRPRCSRNDRTRAAALSVSRIAIVQLRPCLERSAAGRQCIFDPEQLAEFLRRNAERPADLSQIEGGERSGRPALEPLRRTLRRGDRMRAAEHAVTRPAHDTFRHLELEPHPHGLGAILRLARREPRHVGGQFAAVQRRGEEALHLRAIFHKALNSLAENAHAEHQAGAPAASERTRASAAATLAAASSTSSSVVKRPTLNRSVLCARASPSPIAVSTCDASGLSAMQAEPCETAT